MLRTLLRAPLLLPACVVLLVAFLLQLAITGCEDAWLARVAAGDSPEDPT